MWYANEIELSEQTQENRRRRRERILALVIFGVVLLLGGVEVYLLRLSAQLPFVNSIFFFGLMNLNIVLIMLLLFLVFRNVVKLILDEKRGKIGSRLKTRLVFSFLLFAIIPTVLLFSISAFYIRSSFDKWFSVKIGGTMQKSIEVVQNYYETTKNKLVTIAMITSQIDGLKFPGDVLLNEWKAANLLHPSLARLPTFSPPKKGQGSFFCPQHSPQKLSSSLLL